MSNVFRNWRQILWLFPHTEQNTIKILDSILGAAGNLNTKAVLTHFSNKRVRCRLYSICSTYYHCSIFYLCFNLRLNNWCFFLCIFLQKPSKFCIGRFFPCQPLSVLLFLQQMLRSGENSVLPVLEIENSHKLKIKIYILTLKYFIFALNKSNILFILGPYVSFGGGRKIL